MNVIKRPSPGKSLGEWQKMQNLIIRDSKIPQEYRKNGMVWQANVNTISESISSGGSSNGNPFHATEQLKRVIKSYLTRDNFRAEFHFRGHQLEEIHILD